MSDADRGVYETLALRLAQHPSETDEYLVARVLAYCLEYADGIQFSRGGLSEPDEPAVLVRDLTGAIQAWIEVGTPDAARLHRAAKASPRVAVYCHKAPDAWRRQLAGERIHRAEAIDLFVVDRDIIAAIVGRLSRRLALGVTVSGGEIYVSIGEETIAGRVARLS